MLFGLFPRLSGRVLAVLTAVSMIMSLAPVYAPDLHAGTIATGSVSIVPSPSGADDEGESVAISYDSGPGGFMLSGWTFNNVGGSAISYTFPPITLTAGDTFKICAPNNTDGDCLDNWTSGSFTNGVIRLSFERLVCQIQFSLSVSLLLVTTKSLLKKQLCLTVCKIL